MNKIGFLVHPFWMYLNGTRHLDAYTEIIESNKYDTLYILLPSITPDVRRILFSTNYSSIITYYLGIENDVMSDDELLDFYSIMDNLLEDNPRYKFIFNKLILKYLKEHNVSTKSAIDKRFKKSFLFCFLSEHREEIIKNISDEYLEYMFYGDMSNCPIRANLINRLLSVKSKTKILPLWYGGVESFINIVNRCNFMFNNINNTVEVFGEYVNVCVINIAKYLKSRNIKCVIIKDKSIYYSKSMSKNGFQKKNRLKKYLAVYNPPVEDDERNILIGERYYD